MHIVIKIITSIVFLTVGTRLGHAEKKDIPPIHVVAVTDHIYMLTAHGAGNIGAFIGEDGILLIDSQFANRADAIREALSVYAKGKPRYLINTHWHADHTDGNKAFGPDATVIAHYNVREWVSHQQHVALFGIDVPALPKNALPDITYDSSLFVHFNNEKIKIIHFSNGHTNGDSIVFFSTSNVVHMGVHFFHGIYPFIDLNAGGSINGLIRNIASALSALSDDVRIIPGHGPLATRADLQTYYHFLVDSRDAVQAAIANGRSLTDIQGKGLPAKWDHLAGGFLSTDQWLSIVYNSLTGTQQDNPKTFMA